MKKLKKFWYTFLKYSLAGGPGLLVYFIIYFTLTNFCNIYYIYSAIIGSIPQGIVSFPFQKFHTFKENGDISLRAFVRGVILSLKSKKFWHINFGDKKTNTQFVEYVVLAVFYAIINIIILFILIDRFNLEYLLSQLISTAFLSLGNFLIAKDSIFKFKLKNPDA